MAQLAQREGCANTVRASVIIFSIVNYADGIRDGGKGLPLEESCYYLAKV